MRAERLVLIEGYASIFGLADLEGDILRAGAFAHSLQAHRTLPMLLQHRPGKPAGRWSRIHEDGYGLFVRGLVDAPDAIAAIDAGLDGLSIGFHARDWQPNSNGGRALSAVDLVEISLVAEPCQRRARFSRLTHDLRRAA
jgi:uncharacterized protein